MKNQHRGLLCKREHAAGRLCAPGDSADNERLCLCKLPHKLAAGAVASEPMQAGGQPRGGVVPRSHEA